MGGGRTKRQKTFPTNFRRRRPKETETEKRPPSRIWGRGRREVGSESSQETVFLRLSPPPPDSREKEEEEGKG